MSNLIHPTAIIHPKANISKTAKIGPFCTIGEHVSIADNVELVSHVVADGHTTIGLGTKIFPFATVGLIPQDLKYKGEDSRLEIGKNNTIREHVTLHLGTKDGGMLTKVGDNNLLMVSVHIAHDCQVGSNVILANNASLAGHVIVEDFVIIGGFSAIHQFVRIGSHAMVGGFSGVAQDVIPFGTIVGSRGSLEGINLVGMRRRGFGKKEIHAVRHFFDRLKAGENLSHTLDHAAQEEEFINSKEVQYILKFMRDDTSRQYMMPADN